MQENRARTVDKSRSLNIARRIQPDYGTSCRKIDTGSSSENEGNLIPGPETPMVSVDTDHAHSDSVRISQRQQASNVHYHLDVACSHRVVHHFLCM